MKAILGVNFFVRKVKTFPNRVRIEKSDYSRVCRYLDVINTAEISVSMNVASIEPPLTVDIHPTSRNTKCQIIIYQ
jgi:hypothetical protein